MIAIKKIGLTGGIACGKSSVIKILRSLGIKVINADELARQALEPNTPAFAEVLKVFGRGVLNNDGQIDRKKLGEIVFQDKRDREKLEYIIHPIVIDTIKEEIRKEEKQGREILVVEAPLLFEVGTEDLFDQIWVISAPEEEQLQRLKNRDNLSEEDAQRRIKAQLPLSYKERKADKIIHNNKGLTDLAEQVKELLEAVLHLNH